MKVLSVSYPAHLCQQGPFEFAALERLRKPDYSVALFPELTVGGYNVRDMWLSQDYLKSCEQRLSSIAELQRDWHKSVDTSTAPLWVIGAPHVLDGVCYNAAFVMRKGNIEQIYHKNCLVNSGVFDEYRYFRPGKELGLFTREGIRCGILICEDVWSDKMIKRYATQGVDLLLVLSASPFEIDKQHKREQRFSMLSRQHQVAVVANNLCGAQDDLIFDGVAFACNAEGSLVLRSQFLSPGVAGISLDTHKRIHAMAKPAIHPIPASITQLRTALIHSIRDYARNNQLDNIVLGLSGGIDSAVCLSLAADAMEAEQISALMIVGPHTSALSIDLSQELANRLGVQYRTVDIGSMFQASVQVMRRCFRGRMLNVVRENLQARLRCCVLAGLANQKNSLLLCTTNKSEAAVGYGTLYGDLAGGIAPLLDVTKRQVYQLAWDINLHEEVIPEGILTRAPSAELSENQTDEESLMPYDALDRILYYQLELGLENSELRQIGKSRGGQFNTEQIELFQDLMARSEYKRRQAPMGFKVSPMTFVSERRYPVSYYPQDFNNESQD